MPAPYVASPATPNLHPLMPATPYVTLHGITSLTGDIHAAIRSFHCVARQHVSPTCMAIHVHTYIILREKQIIPEIIMKTDPYREIISKGDRLRYFANQRLSSVEI